MGLLIHSRKRPICKYGYAGRNVRWFSFLSLCEPYTGRLNFLPCNTLVPNLASLHSNLSHPRAGRRALTWYNKSKRNPNIAPSALCLQSRLSDPHTPLQSTYTANSGYTTSDTAPAQKDSASLSFRLRRFVGA